MLMQTQKPAMATGSRLSGQRLVTGADLWRSDHHGAHHLRQLHLAGGSTDIHLLASGRSYIMQVDLSPYTAVGISRMADRDKAAAYLVSLWRKQQTNEARVILAPEPLAMSLRAAWRGQAEVVVTDQYLSCSGVTHEAPNRHLPVTTAREMQKHSGEVGRQMAQCWMRYHGEWHKPEQFEGLLAQSNALVWQEEGGIKAFQLFTDLSPSQILIGRHCGPAREVTSLFTQLAARNHNKPASLLSTCVEVSNGPAIDRLHRFGFKSHADLRFSTLVLS